MTVVVDLNFFVRVPFMLRDMQMGSKINNHL